MAKIISGSSYNKLAQSLSKKLCLQYVATDIKKFADEEFRIQLSANFHEEDVIIVQSTCKPANDHIMELLLLVDAAKRAGARRAIALVPYFGYSRQDRPSYDYGPISARLVATLMEASGIDHLITVDLHSVQSEGFFKISVQNLDPTPLFAAKYQNRSDVIVVSPDIGGLIRARRLSSALNADIAIINKTRVSYNNCQMSKIIGNVSDKHCILVDDIADTGNTLCNASKILLEHNALSIEACITHPVLSNAAILNLEQSNIKRILITDTIPQNDLPSKFKTIEIAPLLVDSVQRIVNN